MKKIPELQKLFEEINKLKSKASLNTSQFCSELINSDDDEYLELHFSLLEQKKKYFQSDLKMFFGFRQNKEKAHNFLKSKLHIIQDGELKNDVKEILKDINFCGLDDFKQWLKDLKSGKRKNKNEFVWAIMKSPFVEYHYSLCKEKSFDEEFRRHLWNRFDEHGEKGAGLLLSKLDNNEDVDCHADIILCLGSIVDKVKMEKERALEYARKFANARDDYLRDSAIIVLGWIGNEKDIPLLCEHLLNDTNAKCRAWSATSFMQMNFRRKSKQLADKALPYLQQAVSQETDYYALGCMIDVVKELSGKKFDLPQYAIDNIDKEKILAAKLKVERFFKKLYGK